MDSQFGSLGYTIMEKTADLTVVQKTIIDTLHKEDKPQTFIAKEASRGRLQTWSKADLWPRQFYAPVVPDASSRGRPLSI